jgi:hypothetical protein
LELRRDNSYALGGSRCEESLRPRSGFAVERPGVRDRQPDQQVAGAERFMHSLIPGP